MLCSFRFFWFNKYLYNCKKSPVSICIISNVKSGQITQALVFNPFFTGNSLPSFFDLVTEEFKCSKKLYLIFRLFLLLKLSKLLLETFFEIYTEISSH